MGYSIELHPLAEVELWEAVDWYDEQKADLGKEFARELQSTIQAIQIAPQQFPKILDTKQKAVLQRFPYVIIFETVNTTIYLLAIFHTKRDPAEWKER
jgi:plasmid stabilization system protein ParE